MMTAPTITSVDGVPATARQPGEFCDLTVNTAPGSNDVTTYAVVRQAAVGADGVVGPSVDTSLPIVRTEPNPAVDTHGELVSGGGTLAKTGAFTWRYTA